MSEAQPRQDGNSAHPLDKVVWNALASRHSHLALGDERALRYPAGIAPFAAMTGYGPESFASLRPLIASQGPAAVVARERIAPPPGFSVVRRMELLQMIWQGALPQENGLQHVRLAEADVPDMLALTAATQPGPYGPRTIELGNYFGVRQQGKLAAMAGERLGFDGYTEISAVCVDPAFRGQGLAAGLIHLLISTIRARGETPFLHALTSNASAIALYRKLGFVDRALLHLTLIGIEAA